MKYGLMEFAMPVSWDKLLCEASKLGFEGVELVVKEDFEQNQLWTNDGINHVKQLISDTGSEIISICLAGFSKWSLYDDDVETRKVSDSVVRYAINACAQLGAGVILIPTFGAKDDAAIHLLTEGLKNLADYAEKEKVCLGIECNLPVEKQLKIVEDVGSPFVKIYYDVGNAKNSGFDPAREIERMKDALVQVHIKDAGGKLLGEGKVDLDSVINALVNIGYDDYLVLETPPTDNPVNAAFGNLRYLKLHVEINSDPSHARIRSMIESQHRVEREISIPGRVCLFGEHSDWAGGYRKHDPSISKGYCLAIGTDQGIHAKFKRHPDKFVISSVLPNGEKVGPIELPMDSRSLYEAAEQRNEFFRYAAGVAFYINKLPRTKGGLVIEGTGMDLPLHKGVSSSAAICILVARAFNQAYDLQLSIDDEMEIAYLGEILTGSQCGRMDQACAYGQVPVFLTFDKDNVQIDQLASSKPIYMVIVDLKAEKDTVKILSDLNACFPDRPDRIAKRVRYALGPRNRDILMRARAAITNGDSHELGLLMTEAQDVFDEFVAPASPEQLAAPKLHQVLSFPKIQKLIWGGKGVGSQGDGTAQFVARGEEEREVIKERLEAEMDVECFMLTIRPIHEERAIRY